MKAKELAEKLGVSQTTLSMVINNKGNISRKTRDRITQELAKLGYSQLLQKPEKTAKAMSEFLNENETKPLDRGCIGLVRYINTGLFVDNSSFFPLVLDGMDKVARQNGYRFIIVNVAIDMSIDEKLRYIKKSGCDGVVIYAPELTDEDAEHLEQLDMNFVLMDRYYPDRKFFSVTLDNEQGMYELLLLLKKKGHKTIGYVKSDVNIQSFEERRISFFKHVKKLGMNVFENKPIEVGYPENNAFISMDEYLKSHKNLPSAFVCDNDCVALGVVRALQKNGYNIPDDVAVTGFADRPQCLFVTPNITTARISRESFGGEAVDMLINKVINKRYPDGSVIHTKVSMQIIEREST